MAVKTPHYDKLKWRARRFVDLYVDLSVSMGLGSQAGAGAEAMRRLGFRGKRPDQAAWELRRRPQVRLAIEERRAMVAELANVDAVSVVHIVQETIDRCRQVEPVLDRDGKPVLVQDRDGNLVPAYVFDAKSVLKGAEMLGSYVAMWRQRHELTGKDGGAIEHKHVDELTDEQLEAIARAGRPAPAEPETGEG